jgi:DNA-binding transcriptional ArsR family regulator
MEAAIFDDLTTLSDATRSRMLLLLERNELMVSELCAMLQLPQSTVSRHLKTLADASWMTSRRDGTSRYYALALDDRGPATRRLWSLLREQVRRRRAPTRTPAGSRACWRAGSRNRRSSSRRRRGSGTSCAQDLFGPASHLQALPACSTTVGRRRPGVRDRAGGRGARAVRRPRHRRRSVGRDAAGGAAAGPRLSERRGPARDLEALPIPTPNWTPRR